MMEGCDKQNSHISSKSQCIACVAFVIKHILRQYVMSAQAQALLRFWIQWVQVKEMLHNIGGGVNVGCAQYGQNEGRKMLAWVVRE